MSGVKGLSETKHNYTEFSVNVSVLCLLSCIAVNRDQKTPFKGGHIFKYLVIAVILLCHLL